MCIGLQLRMPPSMGSAQNLGKGHPNVHTHHAVALHVLRCHKEKGKTTCIVHPSIGKTSRRTSIILTKDG